MKNNTKINNWTPLIFLFFLSIILSTLFLNNNHNIDTKNPKSDDVSYSKVIQDIKSGSIVTLQDGYLSVENDGKITKTIMPPNTSIQDLNLDTKNIDIVIAKPSIAKEIRSVIIDFLPIIILVGFSLFLFKGIKSGGGMMKNKPLDRNKNPKNRIKFQDVAGNYEAKQELEEIVDFLKRPKKYHEMGARTPRGVLLSGPPGIGKTLLARAIAGEAGVPFYSMSGSEFEEMFVGVGASRARELFNEAKTNTPSIIFIDELDSVGKKRGGSTGIGSSSSEQTLNQILVEMDGFDTNTNVIIIGATNRPDVLDPALLRPGRFDRQIDLSLPTKSEREEMLLIHSKGKIISKDIDYKGIASATGGFSGADIENVLNEAALLTVRDNKKIITEKTIYEAIEKVALGLTRKAQILSDAEKERTAIHELGHALTSHFSKHSHPVHKVSIIARGRALGVTWYKPNEDKHLKTKDEFMDELTSMLGGHIAERLWLKDVSTGASNDIERATAIARAMVTQFGMSDMGLVNYTEGNNSSLLNNTYSEQTKREVDTRIQKILKEAEDRAVSLLSSSKIKSLLENMKDILLKEEDIDRERFLELVEGKEKKKKTKLTAKRQTTKKDLKNTAEPKKIITKKKIISKK